MAAPSLLVFGPQTTLPSAECITQIRASLLLDQRLRPLRSALEDLPRLWQTLLAASPSLDHVQSLSLLSSFVSWILDGEAFPSTADSPLPNALMTPLTILVHIVQYLNYLDSMKDHFSHKDVLANVAARGGVQGFCTGLLSTMAVACGEDTESVCRWAAVSLALAMCIGNLVDHDGLSHDPPDEAGCLAVRWQIDSGKEMLMKCLNEHPEAYVSATTDVNCVTVTASKATLATLLADLSAKGLTAKAVSLEGRFHSSSYQAAAARLIKLCESSPKLQFPSASSLLAPVGSIADAQKSSKSRPLHEIAIEAILVERCNWYTTISAATSQFSQQEQHTIVQIGLLDCIPASILRFSGSSIVRLRSTQLVPANGGTGQPQTSPVVAPAPMPPLDDGHSADSIAIIGMACKFPGANSVSEFWDLLSEGSSMVKQMPNERFSLSGLRRSPDDKLKFWGNFVDDIAAFDHRFFKKSSREAASMDPQQRLLLQVAYEAMESSGYFGQWSNQATNDTGCYVGVCASDYNDNIASHPPNAYSSLGTLRAFLSGKMSHYFGWTGPSITFDTACSSSAVAIHAACKAIQTGECSRAVAGGVSLYTSPNFFQNLAAASFLSPSGPTKPFDASGDGYCRGEGVGLVVLKRLSDAITDGDHVMGVIAGSAINQNENTTSITVPHSPSQVKLYEKVAAQAGVKPHDVSFVEAHGTGTPVGDPIEFESIRKVFGGADRANTLHVASVKGNIGHLEGASGVAALIKTVLMMEKQVIPIQANHRRLNPKIAPLEEDNLSIPLSTRAWDVKYQVACINNYGAAGSNAAMIVCQAPKPTCEIGKLIQKHGHLPKYPLYISANSVDSLRGYCRALQTTVQKLSTSLSENELLGSLAYNLSHKQNRSLPHVLTTSVSTLAQLQQELAAGAIGTSSAQLQISPKVRPVVLVFGGQISTFVGLDRALLQASSIFRSHLEHCDSSLSSAGFPSIFPAVFRTTPVENIVQLHSMLFSVQYASAMSWIDCGLHVDAIVGHSFGQLTGLCISGVLSLQDCIKLVTARASLMQSSWGAERGSMMSVQADISTVQSLMSESGIDKSQSKLEIACYNATNSHVLVGTSAAIDAAERRLEDPTGPFISIKHKRLSVSHGFHSQFTQPLLPGLKAVAQELDFRQPKIHLETCSNVSGWATFNEELIAEHTRTPVYFDQAVARLADRLGPCTWLEAGSNSSITGMVRSALGSSSFFHMFHASQLSASNATSSLVDATTNLWKSGHKVQLWPFHHRQRIDYLPITLPPYQFEKNRHWLDWHDTVSQAPEFAPAPAVESHDPVFLSFVKYLDSKKQEAEFAVDTRSKEYKFFVLGHAVLAQPLCPAPLYAELASQSAMLLCSTSNSPLQPPVVENLEIQAPLGANDQIISIVLKRSDDATGGWKFTFTTRGRESNHSQIHASGIVHLALDSRRIGSEIARFERLVGHQKVTDIIADTRCEALQGALLYKVFGKVVTYADYYKGVRSVFARGKEVAGNVELPKPDERAPSTVIDPLAIDNFIQVAGLHVNSLTDIGDNEVFVCVKVDRIQPGPEYNRKESQTGSWAVYSNYHPTSEKEIVNDIFVFDASTKKLVLVVLGAHFTRVMVTSLTRVLSRANISAAASQTAPSQDSPIKAPVQKKPVMSVPLPAAPAQVSQQMIVPSSDTSLEFKKLLNSVTEVPLVELVDTATLEDLGVDSLMVTEVLGEINKAFSVSISMDEFAQMTDIASVVRALDGLAGSPGMEQAQDFSSDEDDDESSMLSTPRGNGSLTPITAPGTPSAVKDLILELGTLVAGHLELTEALKREDNLADQGLDSLLCMELASDIKKIFNVDFDMAQLTTESTFGDLVDLVSAQVQVAPIVVSSGPVRQDAAPVAKVDGAARQSHEAVAPLVAAQSAFEDVRFDYDVYTKQSGFYGFWKQVYPTQAELVLAYTVEAFKQLGCDLASLKPGAPLPSIQYLPKHQKLVEQLYNVLRDGLLIATSVSGPVRSDAPVDVNTPATILKRLHAKAPQHVSEHKLLDITGSKLADCLSGAADPLALLFRATENKVLLEDVYAHGPMYEAISKLLTAFFGKVCAGQSSGEKFHILELGGGTGGTTKHIVEYLVQQKIPFTYTFTDLSGSLVAAARKKFSGRDYMQFRVLDIEKQPKEELVGKYHAVISTNCIHATRNLELSTKHIRQMLCPGGFVALVEFTRNMYWFDLVFGLLDGWWLFNDGREHVLADEWFWDRSMRKAGFEHVTWTDGTSEEARTLRIICGFNDKPHDASFTPQRSPRKTETAVETVLYKQVGPTALFADIYYPPETTPYPRPIALMIHGGGHVMLSRKDVRPKQTAHLHALGFLPLSIDYRLCPEVTLPEGPMEDAVSGLDFARQILPSLRLLCPHIRLSPNRTVVVGWSTGGHLALTTAFTSIARGLAPPTAILAFYCPTDYEDECWSRPNFPEGSGALSQEQDSYDPRESVQAAPITKYNVPARRGGAAGGWYAPGDARSRLVLHMNWRGQCLPVLLNGLAPPQANNGVTEAGRSLSEQPQPEAAQVVSVSPYAQILRGIYRTPTCIVHGEMDDLIPWQQSERVGKALREKGVRARVEIVEGKKHLFDLGKDGDGKGWEAVRRGYEFLSEEVGRVK